MTPPSGPRLARLLGAAVRLSGDPRDEYFQRIVGVPDLTDGAHRAVARFLSDPASICVDAGANLGIFTLALARLCPAGRVFAFEPSIATSRYLADNVAQNGYANVEVVQAALGDRDGFVSFHEVPTFAAGSFTAAQDLPFGSGPTRSEACEVRCETLDGFAKRRGLHRIDFVKVDVEGAELSVLEGARALLASARPIVLVEFNSFTLSAFSQTSPVQFLRRLREIFPFVYHIDRENGELHLLGSEQEWFWLLHLNLTGGAVDNIIGAFSRLVGAESRLAAGASVDTHVLAFPQGGAQEGCSLAQSQPTLSGPLGDPDRVVLPEPQRILDRLRLAVTEEGLNRLAAERETLTAERDALAARVAGLERHLRAIEESRGWRVLQWIRARVGRNW